MTANRLSSVPNSEALIADKTVIVQIMANASQARAEMSSFGRSVQRAGADSAAGATKAASGMSTVAAASLLAGKALILGVGAGMAVSAVAATQFETAFIRVAKTVEGNRKSLNNLADDLDNLSRTSLPAAVEEILAVAEVGGQLGISVAGMESFTETMVKLASATNLTADEAGTNIARFAELMGNTEQEFDELGAVLVELGNNLPATEQEILSLARNLAPVASTVNTTSDAVLGLAGALAAAGQPAERSTTAIQRTFVQMEEAIAAGGKELFNFGKVANMTGNEFAELYKRDAVAALAAFTSGLGDVVDRGESATLTLRGLGITSVRQTQVLTALASNSEQFATSLRLANEQFDDATALNEEFEKAALGTNSILKLMGNAVKGLARDFGQGLTPAIRVAAGELTDFANNDSTRSFAENAGIGFDQLLFDLSLIPNAFDSAGTYAARFGGILTDTVGELFRSGEQEDIFQFFDRLKDNFDIRTERSEFSDNILKAKAALSQFIAVNPGMENQFENLQDFFDQMGQEFPTVIPDMLELLQRRYQLTSNEMEEFLEVTLDNAEALNLSEEAILALSKALNLLDPPLNNVGQQYAAWQRSVMALNPELKRTGQIVAELANILPTVDEAIKGIAQAQLDSVSAASDYVSAVEDLQVAYMELQEEDTIENQRALQEAFLDAREAALDLNQEGVGPLIKEYAAMRDMGLLTEQQFQTLVDRVLEAKVAMGALSGAASLTGISFEDLEMAALEADVQIGTLISRIYGLNAVMAAGITTAAQFAQAMVIAGGAGMIGIDPSISAAARRSASNEVLALAEAMRSAALGAGRDIGTALNSGIARGLSGDGGSSEAEKAAEDAGADAARAFIAGMRANLNLREAREDLTDVKQELKDLAVEYINTASDIRQTIADLAKARRDAAQVTIRESRGLLQAELDILNAERDLYLLRQEQASIPEEIAKVTQDLADAQEAYNQALIDADNLERQNDANLTSAIARAKEMARAYGLGEASFADMIEAERRLAEEIASQGESDEARAQAEEEYADAVEEAQRRIEELRFREKQIQLELAIAQKDLIIASEDYLQLQKDSIGPTQEVLDLEEQLAELRERMIEIREETVDGERDVLKAELDLLEATLAYKEAQAEVLDLQPHLRDSFYQLADAVLGSSNRVGQLEAVLVPAVAGFKHLETTAASAAASAEQSAARAAAAVTAALSAARTAANIHIDPAPTPTGSNSPVPMGPYYIAHQGAYFPGPPTREFNTIVRGGEMVVDADMISKAVARGLGGSMGTGTVVVQLDGKEISRYLVDNVKSKVESDMRTARRMS